MKRRLFTQAAVRWMQGVSESYMTSIAVITTPMDDIPDGHGGYKPGAKVVNVYPARFAPVGQRTAREVVLAQQYTDEELKLVILPVDAVVTGQSTLVLDGVKHDVLGLLPLTSFPMERKVVTRAVAEVPNA